VARPIIRWHESLWESGGLDPAPGLHQIHDEHPMNEHRLTKPGRQDAALRDYDSVRRAIAFIRSTGARNPPSNRWRMQPVTPDELPTLVSPLGRLTPKAFMQALTLDHAKGPAARFRQACSMPARLGLSGRDGCTTCS